MPSARHSDQSERRAATTKRRGAKDFACESCGKVYRHPNCLIKHRWEHNPYWRDAAQFLLSKHQQVQLMEAAAILTGGDTLPTDRALWPSYMSDGQLPEPRIAGDGTIREPSSMSSPPSSTYSTRARSAANTQRNVLGSPMTSGENDSDVDNIDEDDASDGDEEQDEEEDDKTDESDVYPSQPYNYHSSPRAVDIRSSHRSPAPSHHYHPYPVSPRVASHNSPVMRAGWGVISESNSHPQSPPSKITMPISYHSTHTRTYSGQHSMSSFSPITQSFSSASTSSYIPHSSVRDVEAPASFDAVKTRRPTRWSPPVQQALGDHHDHTFEMDMDDE